MLALRAAPWHELGISMRVTDNALWITAAVMLPVALLMSAAVVARIGSGALLPAGAELRYGS